LQKYLLARKNTEETGGKSSLAKAFAFVPPWYSVVKLWQILLRDLSALCG
jgi:hypothetical protein